ncbi:MAG TPA: ROK family protein [Chitinophagaceae bacterium]|jgi:polyphosphate glucokinase|nr:ROK family protein [Chitinophagaceae bacterium]
MIGENYLCIDIGGSHIKAAVLDASGLIIQPYSKAVTPAKADPQQLLKAIQQLVTHFSNYDKIAVGFPGYIKNGVVQTAPNLDNESWRCVELQSKISEALQKPCKLVNDADLQGIGIVEGHGFEIMITLGTGFGSAFLYNGVLLPHIELAHHPLTKKMTYDDFIGEKAIEKIGKKKWNKRMQKVLKILKTVFNYDHLYLGGGNTEKINFPLDENITKVTNLDGIKGGPRMWVTTT